MSDRPVLRRIVPCLWLDDQAEQLAAFYTETFPDSRIVARSTYPESADNPAGKPRGSVLTVELDVAGQRFTALDGGPQFQVNPSISFFVHSASAGETRRLGAALAEGGKVMMPVASYPWSDCYGWVQDRFGVSWQLMTAPPDPAVTTIAPCLMFSGERRGQAEPALQAYAGIFTGGRVERVERYGPGEGAEGQVKHGRCSIAGHSLFTMDSHIDHGFRFDAGVSLQVMCDDQAEVDRYWDALSAGGKPGPCGWLEDRFGVSWQVVPSAISRWMSSPDAAARDRAFAAVMGMSKLDIAALDAAFRGG